MKEYPILFQTNMVQAVLDDRKTQTRRTTGLKEINQHPNEWQHIGSYVDSKGELYNQFQNVITNHVKHLRCPYGKEVSPLWVRETWFHGEDGYGRKEIHFLADNPLFAEVVDGDGYTVHRKDGSTAYPWRPSIHMKKEDCRIYLQNTGVRVQRLQDINEVDAIAEGIERLPGEQSSDFAYKSYAVEGGEQILPVFPIVSFQTLIQSIHGPEIWNQNPWVWAISFRVLSKTGRPDKFPELCEAP